MGAGHRAHFFFEKAKKRFDVRVFFIRTLDGRKRKVRRMLSFVKRETTTSYT